jgi:hypothetical protein|uniref:Uncharacterized protein n=1 Tax=viral metagenome TaxID=1070528 RepID=A0A6C0BKF2_9ZZZZ
MWSLSSFLVNDLTTEDSMIFAALLILCAAGIYAIYRHRISDLQSQQPPPVKVTIEQHIYRVSEEDQTDLMVEDRHNVHNKCLKRSAAQVIHHLKDCDRHQFTIDSAFQQIFEMIDMSPDDNLDRLDHAMQVLKAIQQMNCYYHSGYVREKELVRLVWERIHHPVNHDRVEQLKNNLIDQLADGYNGYSNVHCLEGRVMRLLQTLECCDQNEMVQMRPMWAYKDEISSTIARYRDKLLQQVPTKYIELETKIQLTEQDRALVASFNQCLINNLNRRFDKDYLSPGLLTKEELEEMTHVYYQSLYD